MTADAKALLWILLGVWVVMAIWGTKSTTEVTTSVPAKQVVQSEKVAYHRNELYDATHREYDDYYSGEYRAQTSSKRYTDPYDYYYRRIVDSPPDHYEDYYSSNSYDRHYGYRNYDSLYYELDGRYYEQDGRYYELDGRYYEQDGRYYETDGGFYESNGGFYEYR